MTTSLLDLIARASDRSLRTYSKRVLIDLSHDVEGRVFAGAPHPPLVFGGFQRGRFYATERARWEEIARRSTLTVVAAGGLATEPDRGPRRPALLGVGPDDPFWHDWLALVYAGPEHGGVLIARDETGGPGAATDQRSCRGVWTYDARVARAAALWVGEYLGRHDPALARRWNAGVTILSASTADRIPTRSLRRTA